MTALFSTKTTYRDYVFDNIQDLTRTQEKVISEYTTENRKVVSDAMITKLSPISFKYFIINNEGDSAFLDKINTLRSFFNSQEAGIFTTTTFSLDNVYIVKIQESVDAENVNAVFFDIELRHIPEIEVADVYVPDGYKHKGNKTVKSTSATTTTTNAQQQNSDVNLNDAK